MNRRSQPGIGLHSAEFLGKNFHSVFDVDPLGGHSDVTMWHSEVCTPKQLAH